MPRVNSYPILATFSLGMHAFDASLIVMPFEEAQVKKVYQKATELVELVTKAG